MVYRGRPSAACFACRTRRIKCDAKNSGCSQCARMRIVCPGYRDPLDQLFRDESTAVIRRAQRSYKALSSSRQSQKPDVISLQEKAAIHDYVLPGQNLALTTLSCAPRPSLIQSIDDVALAYFMSSYVPGSHFVYLPELYNSNEIDTALPATVHAASLARLAWELREPNLMREAKRAYSRALSKTNISLSKPAIATTDAVLVSVLLLSLYETIICADANTPENWIKHTRGALALVHLRGEKQLENPVGRILFTQVANIICVDSLRTGTRLAPGLVDLQKAALLYTDEYVKDGHLTPLEVVDAAQRLEAKYIVFTSSLPTYWKYGIEVLHERRTNVYGTIIHKYPNNRVALFWNSYRMTRIFLNGIVHGYARYLRSPNTTVLARAERNARQMAADICASVPQIADASHFSIASAATLLWPLSTVRSADLVGEEMRRYAEGRLAFVGRELRSPQVEKVASSREVDALQDGLHMFYLS